MQLQRGAGPQPEFLRWFATVQGIELFGDASTQADAIEDAQAAIDRAIKLVGPVDE